VSESVDIRLATIKDLTYIDHLQRRNAEELSFYPQSAFEREVSVGRIIIALVNDEPAGYLYHGALRERVNIHQACIEYDLRGMLYGSRLVAWLRDTATSAGSLNVTCHCGSDIAANFFWRAMGFYCESTTQGGVRRMRDINHWRIDLHAPLFVTSIEPSDRQQDASLWRRTHGDQVSQFIRGNGIKAYRSLLEEKDADSIRIKIRADDIDKLEY
jgi:hypothetical protein